MGNTSPQAASNTLSPPGKRKVTNVINKINVKDFNQERHMIKLLLLGTGESGKTTLLKQMKLLYGTKTPMSRVDKEMTIKSIRSCIIGNMQELITKSEEYFPIQDKNLLACKEQLLAYSLYAEKVSLSSEQVEILKTIWNDEGVQKTWEENRNLIQVQDALPHFMSRVEEIFNKEYEPTDEDWLRVRVRTAGIKEEMFMLDDVNFKIVDVGGQRNERKKWLHCFNNVHAVIYVVALNEYDQLLFEDVTVNRMTEALDLFEKVVNDENLAKSGWILFFNKSDLYREKLNKSPIKYVDKEGGDKSRFTDFKGPHCKKNEDPLSERFQSCYAAGIDYFDGKFRSKVHPPAVKEIFMHVTCAMDQHNVFVVFNACRGMILKTMIQSQGFITSF